MTIAYTHKVVFKEDLHALNTGLIVNAIVLKTLEEYILNTKRFTQDIIKYDFNLIIEGAVKSNIIVMELNEIIIDKNLNRKIWMDHQRFASPSFHKENINKIIMNQKEYIKDRLGLQDND